MADELRDVQRQINQKTDESLDSTRRMVGLCQESKDIGIQALVHLDEQGEKLDRVEEGMTKINRDMREAEKNLEGLEKCCGLCVLPWKRSRKVREDSSTWTPVKNNKVTEQEPRKNLEVDAGQPQAGFIQRITHDAREDEMEQNMAEVSGMLGNLKNLAIDMNQEISSQNTQLDRINAQASVIDQRVSKANTRANKILKN